ncbi:MAG: hypothetical protein V4440_09680, partial [Pseudomonadota bacterium]
RSTNITKQRIVLINGARIWFKSGEKPNSLYGEDVYSAVLDEASRMREKAYIAVRSTLTKTGGKLRIIGNVQGRKNWAWRLGQKAAAGLLPDAGFHALNAYDAVAGGVFKLDAIEKARLELPEHEFRELYLNEPADDGGNPFGLQFIQNCVKPFSTLPPAAFGIDFGKYVDFTAVTGFDKNGAVCKFLHVKENWEQTVNKIIPFVGDVPALCDATGIGDAVVERLNKQSRCRNYEPFVYNHHSKNTLIEGLAVDIQQGRISFPGKGSPGSEKNIQLELESFEYVRNDRGEYFYNAPEGMHDDCVNSLALAAEKLLRRKPDPRIINANLFSR